MQAIIYFMETRATFNLRVPKSEKPTNIFFVCKMINGKQIKINIGTDYKIYPKHWNKEKQTVMIDNSLPQLCIEHYTKVNNDFIKNNSIKYKLSNRIKSLPREFNIEYLLKVLNIPIMQEEKKEKYTFILD